MNDPRDNVDLARSVSQYYLDQIRKSTRSVFLSRLPGRQRLLWGGVMAVVGFWVLDAAIGSAFFYRRPFYELLLFDIPPAALYVRLLVSVLLGVLAYVLMQVDQARELEQALERSSRWFSTTLKSLGAAIVATDKYGDVIFMNDDALHLTGWALDQAIGRPVEEICPIVVGEGCRGAPLPLGHKIRQDLAFGLPTDCCLQSATGLCVHVGGSLAPIKARDGALLGSVLVLHDLSAYRRLEEARRQLATAVTQAPDPVVMTDPQGRVVYVNPACEALAGLPASEMVGSDAAVFAPRIVEDEAVAELVRAVGSGESWRGLLSWTSGDAETNRLQVVAAPVVSGRQVVNVVCLARDVTRETELQKQLIQAQKMEAIGTLAAGVAHDFNNILTIIGGFATVLEMDTPPTPDARHAVSEINAAVGRAEGLTRQLLAFSRREAARPRTVELNAAFGGMHAMLDRLLGRGVSLDADFADEPLPVLADPTHLEQILVNLVVNARDAMPDGGRIVIRTRRGEAAEVGLPGVDGAPHGIAVVEVEDNGCGVPPELQEQVFEAFFTTKSADKGTGLGLSVVRDIIAHAGGGVQLESSVGNGTTVRFGLPLTAAETVVAGSPVSRPVSGSGMVLVLDDEPALRLLVGSILREAGYTVIEAEDGKTARRKFASAAGSVDVVVADVAVRRENGAEIACSLQGDCVAVVVMTAHADQSVLAMMDAADGRWLLQKPFQREQLLDYVATAMEWRRKRRR